MNNDKKQISQNSLVSEEYPYPVKGGSMNQDKKAELFVNQKANTKLDIQKLIKYIGRETNRQKLDYAQLKYIFREVRKRCHIEVSANKSRKLYELPSSEDLKRFYGAIDDPIHKLIFETLQNTGLRVSELCRLEVKRIDFKTNLVFVSEGKGKKDRVTVIGSKLLEKIRIYLKGRSNRYLFESNRNTMFSSRRIEQLCKKYKTKAGITICLTPHSFRHLLFSRLAEAGVSKEKRMILAGHSSEQVQDIYTHLGIGGVKQDVLAILDRELS
ncbi:MAG: tyrosine-type recombinase/integrase [Bacteriovoracia bacterium]